MVEGASTPLPNTPYAWLCDACHRHSYEEFPTRESALEDAHRHREKVHPGEKVEMAVARKPRADTPVPGGFPTLCGACMGPVDETIYPDANIADEAGEVHRQRLHPKRKNVVIIVLQAWVFEAHRKKSLANLLRLQREADHGELMEPFGHREAVNLG